MLRLNCAIIKVHLTASNSIYLIHTNVLSKWQQAAIEDVSYDIDDQHCNLKSLMREDFYSASAGSRNFKNMEDFLLNQNPIIY